MGKRYLIDSNTLIEYTGKLLPVSGHDVVTAIINDQFNISFINKTIELRKNLKIKIPDAIIAATALTNDLILVTRNTDDFRNMTGLEVMNPWDIS